MKKRSNAWHIGYLCQGPKCRNPYPYSTEEGQDWLAGWLARFHGDKV